MAELPLCMGLMERLQNFYGSRTINGADVAATFYTIIESCKKVELDPKSYISMALNEKLSGRQAPTPFQYAKQIRSGKDP